jgi:predicted metal-dependent phosphoesterase TrpH
VLIDLHCHTTGSQDSRLRPREAVALARDAGLDALCFTEHDFLWPQAAVRALSQQTGFPIFAGVEVSTEIGHVLAYGLPEFNLDLRNFARLVQRARQCGSALVLAHPYRRHYRFELPTVITGPDVRSALRRRGLSQVVALESGNGGTRPIENTLARRVAEHLGMPTTAGSDAHAPERMGRWATEIDGEPDDDTALASAIITGRIQAVPITAPTDGNSNGGATA